MELTTDILAIFGWAFLGMFAPHLYFFKFESDAQLDLASKTMFLAFSLIAASLVLG